MKVGELIASKEKNSVQGYRIENYLVGASLLNATVNATISVCDFSFVRRQIEF